MDLESPLRTLASPVGADVLRVLSGADTDFSTSHVHRLSASGSLFGIRKALARLAESGLVTATTHGNSIFWRGNRQHVLWPSIELAADARSELVRRLGGAFAERNELAAYLYGSFARRTATRDSDIDILVVHPDDAEHDEIVDFSYELSQSIAAWTGNEGQIFAVTRSGLRDSIERSDPVVTSIRQDAVPLSGPTFEDLLDVLTTKTVSRG